MERSSRIPVGRRLTVRLTGGVILALLLVGAPFFIAFQRHLRIRERGALEEATTTLSRLVVDGLRSSMLAGQPHLLDEAIRSLADQRDVERVILLDHRGRVSITSDPSFEGRTLQRDRDPTCIACHRTDSLPPDDRTAVIEEAGRRIFRAMNVIPNEPRCHACHDASSATNGILLMDLALDAANQRFLGNISQTLALGGVMLLVTIGVLALLLRRMVHAPLQAIVGVSQRIVGGDLTSRACVSGSGEFELLGDQVNEMTDHLSRSIETVETQRRELQEILEAVDDEIVVLDRERRVIAANRAFRRHGSDPEADPAGRCCGEVSGTAEPCANAGDAGCPVQEVFRTGRLQKAIVSRTETGGLERTIEIHASPLRASDGHIEMVVEVRRDISERRQMEASIAHSERLASIGLLASGISHEINNPLGAIAMSVDGLRRRLGVRPAGDLGGIEGLESTLEKIARQVQRGRTITDRFLTIARPGPRGRSLVDLNMVVRDTVGILAHHMQRGGITSSLDLGENLPPLCGDESELGQILMNLSLNAIQAMSGGGTLRIATACSDGTIRIDVEDSGCGIPPESLRRIYEPFFTTKPAGRGTGLGLFVTHRIVSEWNGSIQVSSEPGRGSHFTVRIPVTRGKEALP